MDTFAITRDHRSVYIPEILEDAFGMTRSQGRRIIEEGGFKIDGQKYVHVTCAIMDIDNKVIQVGKRKFAKVDIV